MPYCCIKRKQKKNQLQSACCRCTVKSITKKSSIYMKIFLLWRKLSISKTIRVHAWSSKEVCELVPRIEQSHYPVWWGVSYDSITSLHFCEKCIKTAVRNYQQGILTNVVESLNQICSKIDHIYSNRSLHLHIKAKTMQQWLENHVPEFISCDHWPS